ncbi:hypothetical protein Tco_1469832 [Tanacetum coccineum]
MTEILNAPVHTKATKMTIAPVLETIHKGEEQVTSTPPATPLTKSKIKRTRELIKKAIKKKNDWKKVVTQRLTNLEQKTYDDIIEESVQENVLNVVKNQLPKLLPKVISQALKKTPVIESDSMQIDEQEARFRSTKLSRSKRTHYDQDDTDNHEGEKKSKRRRKDAGESSSKKSKAQKVPPHFETGNDADEPRQGKTAKELHVQSWFNELVDVEEEPEEYEYRDGSVTQFYKLVMKIFKKDVITKDDVNGPSFELLKRTCKNNIELEYNMNQVSLALTDQIDWVNPETNDRFQNDLSKPLPLTGPLGKKRIPVRYFFNHDLEYLMNGTKENTYALSVTKTKAARYEDEGIEEMIPSL